LPSAGQGALGKDFFLKKIKKSLPSACRVGTRQSHRQRGQLRDGRFSLPSASGALGKAFAECPIKDTRQRGLRQSIFCHVFFAECRTRQRLCRVQLDLCRVPKALGKEPESSSESYIQCTSRWQDPHTKVEESKWIPGYREVQLCHLCSDGWIFHPVQNCSWRLYWPLVQPQFQIKAEEPSWICRVRDYSSKQETRSIKRKNIKLALFAIAAATRLFC